MSIPLAPVSITAGTPITVSVGSAGTVGAVVIGNESPYAIMASAGSGGLWVLAQMADRLNCDSMAFSGNITLSASSYLTNANQAPSYQIYLTVYAPGEIIPGTYPCALSRMFNVGNTVNTNAQTPNSLEQDLLTPCVLSGLTATRDGTTASRLDVAGGVALLRQSDQSLGRVAPSATNFTTVQINSTYYLDLNPDGTWSWGTTHSGVTNYLAIAQVTTDASGNIATVTDERILTTSMLNSATPVAINELLLSGVSTDLAPAADARILNFTATNALIYKTTQTGAAQAHSFGVWTGSALNVPFNIGQNGIGASTNIDQNGAIAKLAGQATTGSFGAPVIVAQALAQHVTSTATQTILSFTPTATGLYRFSGSLWSIPGGTLTYSLSYKEGNTGSSRTEYALTTGGVWLNSATVGANVQSLDVLTFSFYAQTGQPITINYTNITATPNDYVSAMIERLS